MSASNELTPSFPLPIGAILPYAVVGRIPNDFLVCDGTEYAIADYPELAAVLNNVWDNAPAVGHFNVPNLVNSYLKGVAANTGTTVTGDIAGSVSWFLTEDSLPANIPMSTANLTFSGKFDADSDGYLLANPSSHKGTNNVGNVQASAGFSNQFTGGTCTVNTLTFSNTTYPNAPVTYNLANAGDPDPQLRGYTMAFIIRAKNLF